VGKARDVSLSIQGNPVDVSSRAGAGWKEFVMGLREFDINVGHIWLPDDTAYKAMRDGLINGTSMAFSLKDAEGYGFTGNLLVTKLENPQPMDGGMMADFACKGTGALTAVEPS
jgi:predicted secreted protein